MKITSITIGNYQRVVHADVRAHAPLLLFAGHNEAGKTSIADAVYHAINGEARRVKLKKDYPDLVHDGAKRGFVSVGIDDGQEGDGGISITLPQDKRTSNVQVNPLLSLLLDAKRFPALTPDDRRKVVFVLSPVKISGKVILDKLLEKGADPKKAKDVGSVLLAGFEAACAEAKTKASEARGAWKAITGEAYGKVKAATWKAEKPEWNGQTITKLEGDLEAADNAVHDLTMKQGDLNAQRRAFNEQEQRKSVLKGEADLLERAMTKLEVDEEQLAEWTQKVEKSRREAGVGPAVEPLTCPHCAGLVELREGKLHQHTPPSGTSAKAKALLPVQEASLAQVQSFVTNDRQAVARAQQAAAALTELTEKGVVNPKQSELDDVAAQLTGATATRNGLRGTLQAQKDARDKAVAAEANTKKAAAFHTDVEQWEAIAEWLAPAGIQAELMATALEPFNKRLARTASITGWDKVSIDADMTIRLGSRPYSLASASARWRAEAALVEALSHVSGERIFMLDELDVQDSANRMAFLKWMHTVAAGGEVDTVLIMGTFKTAPTCPPTFQVEWVEAGRAGVEPEQAQEAA